MSRMHQLQQQISDLALSVKFAFTAGTSTAGVGFFAWGTEHQNDLALIGICVGILASTLGAVGAALNIYKNWPFRRKDRDS